MTTLARRLYRCISCVYECSTPSAFPHRCSDYPKRTRPEPMQVGGEVA